MLDRAAKSKRVTLGGICAAIGGALLTSVKTVVPAILPFLPVKTGVLVGAAVTVVGSVAAGVGKALGQESEESDTAEPPEDPAS